MILAAAALHPHLTAGWFEFLAGVLVGLLGAMLIVHRRG